MSASNSLARIFEINHLTGNNFKDWLKNFRIVLTSKKLSHVLNQDPVVLPNHHIAKQRAAFEKWVDEDSRVKYYVLASMSNELQSQHEYMPTIRAIITHLQELYGEQSHIACFRVSKRFFNLKMHERQSIHEHYMIVIKNIEELEKLRLDMQKEL